MRTFRGQRAVLLVSALTLLLLGGCFGEINQAVPDTTGGSDGAVPHLDVGGDAAVTPPAPDTDDEDAGDAIDVPPDVPPDAAGDVPEEDAPCEPVDEICDGLDNDCDGDTDEALGTQTCGEGICEHTVPNCIEGVPQECDPFEGVANERCDGLDNDCDGDTDEDWPELGAACDGDDADNCDTGTWRCLEDGSGVVCDDPGVSEESCDGVDNDCDGDTDEGFDGLGEACDGDDDDLCPDGERVCNDAGDAVVCSDDAASAVETCDGVDDDCDGETDEGLGTTTCGVGPCEHTIDNCADGAPQTCDPFEGATDEICGDEIDNDCDGATDGADPDLAERTETCDGADEDCDGETDEDFLPPLGDLGEPCDGDDADDCATGAWVCAADGTGTVCEGDDEPREEVCNGQDDDCDEDVDEGLEPRPCEITNGFGTCTGVETCEGADGWVCDAPTPAFETCNGVDDDCDGETDELFPREGQPCDGADADECETGTWTCTAAGDDVECVNETGVSEEVCDGADNDCDGAIDNGMDDRPCEIGNGFGTCGGIESCEGAEGWVCDAPTPAEETCDGVDEDCDGETDEGLGTTTCGTGPCEHTIDNCAGGVPQTCDPLEGASAEVCGDAIDNDCDGLTDGADPDLSERPETCDGVDENCDGQTDEGFALDEPCDGPDSDDCENGVTVCAEDGTDVTCGPEAPTGIVEACNDLDDDCDGQTDEGFALGEPCDGPDTDDCPNGVTICDAAQTGVTCGPEDPADIPELCNDLDDDCDGQTDEDYPGLGDACVFAGDADGCDEDQLVCADDELATVCGDVDPDPVELCNGLIDDDCDGQTDEGFTTGEALCDSDADADLCADDTLVCTADGLGTACEDAGPALVEVCDHGGDEDCDGLVDCDDPDLVCSAEIAGNGIDDDCDASTPDGAATHTLTLTQRGRADGASEWQRTDEPVEIPLVAGGYLDSSVALYLPLEGGTDDASPHARAVTVLGAPTTDTGAVGDGAVCLDGSDDHLSVADAAAFDTDEFTLCAWVRLDAAPFQDIILNKGTEGSTSALTSFKLGFDGTGDLIVQYDESDGTSHLLEAPVAITTGQWHHVCGTRGGDRLSAYLDGALVATMAAAVAPATTAAPVYVGRREGGDYFAGCLDDVVVLDRALTPPEVRAYVDSRQPWGTPLFADAQPDFDDLRVFEDDVAIPFEVVGAQPLADRASDLDAHVVAYWPLDGTGADLTGAHDATVSGASTTTGRFGNGAGALLFDGTDDYVDTTYLHDPGPTDSFTIEAWFRLPRDADSGVILGYLSEDPANLQVSYWGSEGALYASMEEDAHTTGDTTHTLHIQTPFTPDGRWHHIAVVRDRGSAPATLALYLDGVRATMGEDTTQPAGTESFNPSERTLMIGARNDGGTTRSIPFQGAIDEVVVHDVARSADYLYKRAHPLPRLRFFADTAATAEGGVYPYKTYAVTHGDPDAAASPLIPADGLLSPRNGYVGWWRLDEGFGDTAIDASSWRSHAVLSGNATFAPSAEGSALRFDGTTGYAMATVPVDSSEGTMEAVVHLGGSLPSTRWSGVVETWLGGVDGMNMFRYSDADTWFFQVAGPPGNSEVSLPQALLPLDRHVPLAATYGGGFHRVYSDHTLQGEATATGRVALGEGRKLYIGRLDPDSVGGDSWFAGTIDSVRLMNRALAPAELLHWPRTTWALGAVRTEPDNCGGVTCPTLAGYTRYCNAQNACEYANEDASGWRLWDVWVHVPAGSFSMGSPAGESGRDADEGPVHTVVFDEPFLVARYPIVAEAYGACEAAGACDTPSVDDWGSAWGVNEAPARASHPQNGLTPTKAEDFCAWATSGGRLPTEAEWEYAATGPMHRRYAWGDTPAPTCANGTAWFEETSGQTGCGSAGTATVDASPAGASYFGVEGMAGNVWEWLMDCGHSSYTDAPDDGGPWVWDCESPHVRIMRGGAYSHPEEALRTAERHTGRITDRADRGARCVRPVPASSCGGEACPTLPDHTPFCAWQSHCAAAPLAGAGCSAVDGGGCGSTVGTNNMTSGAFGAVLPPLAADTWLAGYQLRLSGVDCTVAGDYMCHAVVFHVDAHGNVSPVATVPVTTTPPAEPTFLLDAPVLLRAGERYALTFYTSNGSWTMSESADCNGASRFALINGVTSWTDDDARAYWYRLLTVDCP